MSGRVRGHGTVGASRGVSPFGAPGEDPKIRRTTTEEDRLELGDDSPATTALKVVLATVLLAIAAYQVLLATVFYGKLRPRFLHGGPAARSHRAVGDATVLVALAVAVICVTGYDPTDALGEGGREALHVVAGSALLVACWRRW